MFGLYDDLTGWITHRLVFLYLFSAVMGLLVSGTPASQAQSSTSFVPPELTAPYTLTFSVQIIKPSYVLENSLYQEKGFDGRQKGILTISSNGTRFLYMAKFGNWSDVIICDKAANDQYKYDTAFANAVVQPGVDDALAGMCLLPMPGTGYDFYPMFQTFTPSATGSSHGAMAVIGAVSSAVDGVAQAMLYQDALVTTRLSGFGETILSCKVVVPQNPALPEDLWTFSDYRMIGSVPVAGSIDHVNYISVGGQWPPSAMQPDGEVRYSLVSSSTKACTDQQFDLRSYLPTGLVVADARDFHPDPSLSNTPRYRWAKTPVSYYFKPDGGTLDEQAEAAVDAGEQPSIPPSPPPIALLANGTKAPDFNVADPQGKNLRLSDYYGHVVLLDFWATWCEPCQESLPDIQRIASTYANKGLIALEVNIFDTKIAFDEWLPQHQQLSALTFAIEYPDVSASNNLPALYHIVGVPTVYVIDRKGKVVDGFVGYNQDSSVLEKAIRSAL